MSLLNRVKQVASSAVDTASELKDTANSTVAVKVQEVVQELGTFLPILKEAGFVISGLQVEIGVPPKIIPSFSTERAVPKEKIEQLIKQHSDKKLLLSILETLTTTQNLQESLTIGNLKFNRIEIEATLIPSVRIVFETEGNKNVT